MILFLRIQKRTGGENNIRLGIKSQQKLHEPGKSFQAIDILSIDFKGLGSCCKAQQQ